MGMLPHQVRTNLARDHGSPEWKFEQLRQSILKELMILEAGVQSNPMQATLPSPKHTTMGSFFAPTHGNQHMPQDSSRATLRNDVRTVRALTLPTTVMLSRIGKRGGQYQKGKNCVSIAWEIINHLTANQSSVAGNVRGNTIPPYALIQYDPLPLIHHLYSLLLTKTPTINHSLQLVHIHNSHFLPMQL